MSEDADTESEEGMTYADAGVDIDASEAATAALVDAVADVGNTTDYAGLVPVGDQYLALATDGVGTKLLVAEAMADYSTVGIDCIAMNVNDLVAAGVAPDAFVDYLAVDEPSETLTAQLGEGLAAGAEEAEVALVGGETAVMPEVVNGFDLAGTVAGLADEDDLFPGDARVGDALVGFASTGIHSNGLTLARRAATRGEGSYHDDYPYEGYETVGEALLEPTRLYTYLLSHLRERDVHAAAHVTGGGWTNLSRMGEHEYDVTDPLPAQDVFTFVRERGDVSDEEMHRTFNMGTGFVVALPEAEAETLIAETDGERVGTVRDGDSVEIRGLSL
ncbi:phosphoribosylformylglycinamidine cyclo-ligase [Halarchaeum nitratireducens]|uniref:Phosphoribosylformylglycinamidine cyclo-ligase n=1 Tax=Halarchaeum nitratireducens TaxID=489913 RepID=A0A830GDG8_9EURY|nr:MULTISPECIES: phosphoribosylformylglycinamidine cyclo-ligase [Halarchaeum]MBP2252174.1 phosphoribosylformylglycinamidine cyclo-ligase [Halarchaeum solikamskense]GGN17412.1 phosphoribosylformylglycinamidine cyclo-ligase [Halarchaeum nitratireducens]